MMSGLWQKKLKAAVTVCGSVLLGVAVVFLALEIFFAASGVVYRAIGQQRNAVALKLEGAVRILCLGESTTEMGGANAYPRQLERALNSQQTKVKFAVINGGLPGGNTSMIVDQLAANIVSYRPDIVVLMMGINDVPAWVVGHPGGDVWLQNPVLRILGKLRLVRFARSVWENSHPGAHHTQHLSFDQKFVETKYGDEALMFSAIKSEAAEQYDQAIMYYKQLIKRFEPHGYWPKTWFIRKVGELFHKSGQNKNYLSTVAYLLRENPQDAWAVDRVGTACRDAQGREEMIPLLTESLRGNSHEAGLHQLLGSCYLAAGEKSAGEAALKKAKSLRVAAVNPLTKANYRQALKILRENGVLVVVASYPMRPFAELANLLDGVEGVEQAVLVDNEKIFKDALKGARYEDYFIDRFAGDFGHCTPKGNHLLADNIASVILKAEGL